MKWLRILQQTDNCRYKRVLGLVQAPLYSPPDIIHLIPPQIRYMTAIT